MQCFNLVDKFDRIIIPYNGILCLLNENDIKSCLKSAANSLTDTGELIFDFYYVPEEETEEILCAEQTRNTDEQNEFENNDEYLFTILDETRDIHVYEKEHPNIDTRRFDVSYVYKIVSDNETITKKEFAIAQRCIYPGEINKLCEDSGLSIKYVYGDFCKAPVSCNTDQIVVHCCL